jgi:type III restriction enzyme
MFDKLNPYSYTEKLQEIMIQKTIKSHFENEKELLTRPVKIKPITLFFIDNIEEYRNEEGYLRTTVERLIKTEVEALLKTEKNTFYKAYLEKTLQDISLTHAGYFSKDNSEKDEANTHLQAILSLYQLLAVLKCRYRYFLICKFEKH